MLNQFKTVLIYLGIISVVIGCTAAQKTSSLDSVKEFRPGILMGYLSIKDLPQSKELVPPPPAEKSLAKALDEEKNREALMLNGSKRWEQAARDAAIRSPKAPESFSCALGVPITRKDTPYLHLLLRRTLTDAGISVYGAKRAYKRPRPFMENSRGTCTPDKEEHLKKDGSYPSGHTAIGWAWALILTEIAPERTNEILARGRAFGESRMVCNVHWYSDVVEGRFMGASTVARLHANETFQADLAEAKKEYAAAKSKGLKPTGDCAAEEEALKE